MNPGSSLASSISAGMNHTSFHVSEGLNISWPHNHFRPFALGCFQDVLFVADRFSIYRTDLLGEEMTPLQPFIAPEGFTMPWNRFSVLSPQTFLFLEPNGRIVLEYATNQRLGTYGKPGRRWSVSHSFSGTLDAITPVMDDDAKALCSVINSPAETAEAHWAFYAATSLGNIIAFCPSGEYLQPVAEIIPASQALESQPIDGLNGSVWITSLHFREGKFWMLTGGGELHMLGLDGNRLDVWQLPPGHRWASGFCLFGDGRMLFATSSVEDGPINPQLWTFRSVV